MIGETVKNIFRYVFSFLFALQIVTKFSLYIFYCCYIEFFLVLPNFFVKLFIMNFCEKKNAVKEVSPWCEIKKKKTEKIKCDAETVLVSIQCDFFPII